MLKKEIHSLSSISCVDEELETQNSLPLGPGGKHSEQPFTNKAWPWWLARRAGNIKWPDMKGLRRMLAGEALSLKNLKPSP